MNEELELARRHVAEAHERIDRQRRLISDLRERGQDTDLAEELLSNLVETTRQMEVHRDFLAAEQRKG